MEVFDDKSFSTDLTPHTRKWIYWLCYIWGW